MGFRRRGQDPPRALGVSPRLSSVRTALSCWFLNWPDGSASRTHHGLRPGVCSRNRYWQTVTILNRRDGSTPRESGTAKDVDALKSPHPAHRQANSRLAGGLTMLSPPTSSRCETTVVPEDPCCRVCTLGACCEDTSVSGSDSGRIERSSAGVRAIRWEIRARLPRSPSHRPKESYMSEWKPVQTGMAGTIDVAAT